MRPPIPAPPANRERRETLLGQRATVAWLTGLSGAGKTTLADGLAASLLARRRLAVVLDGDRVRSGLSSDLGFSERDRAENVRRVAEVAAFGVDAGLIVIVALVSPLVAMRTAARQRIGDADFHEIYVRCPIEICAQRDPKGLYALARQGKIQQLTGVDCPYDAPANPDLLIDTSSQRVEEAVEELTRAVLCWSQRSSS